MKRHGGDTRSRFFGRARATAAAALLTALVLTATSGCAMNRLRRDLSEAKGLGLISGPVETPDGGTENVVVALYRHAEAGPELEDADRLTSTVGNYAFIVEAGQPYLIAAFQDADGDLMPDATEPATVYGLREPIVVEPGESLEGRRILLHADSEPLLQGIDFSGLPQASFDSIPIAAGEIASLDDERFSLEQAKAGMWSPLTAVREVGGGIFFLEPYDPERIPVLFVHGIGGSPRDFGYLIEGLDRERFQPWIYHYPSGVRLERAGRLLSRLTTSLRQELGVERLFLTAHSMGGLVARSSLLQIERDADRGGIELFVTFSTPWNGHRGAAQGVKYAPAVVPSWIDMQPESDFLEGLESEPPGIPPHHLFFGFHTRKNPLMLYSHDTVIAVGSQIHPWFQERAERIYGFDLDHVGILNDEDSARTYHRILGEAAVAH
ncbi:MAG: hypothetical protein GY719_01600 [bacterium]|nr:hypothetical protein [bacterium]